MIFLVMSLKMSGCENLLADTNCMLCLGNKVLRVTVFTNNNRKLDLPVHFLVFSSLFV